MISHIRRCMPLMNRRTIDTTLIPASVLLTVTDHPHDPEIWFGVRSQALPTHKGEVALLGGKQAPEDQSVVATALREAQEEAGLSPANVEVLGLSHTVISRWGFVVTPVVGVIPSHLDLFPDGNEMESLFKVPLAFFLDKTPEEDLFERKIMPRWHYGEHKIWGMTATIIAEFVNEVFDTHIQIQLGLKEPASS